MSDSQRNSTRRSFLFPLHGECPSEEDPHSKEKDKREESTSPCDVNPDNPQKACIQYDVLKELWVDRLPIGNHLMAVFDSCHSQSLLDLEHWRCN
ncbi:hypothetical protein VKT23_014112 [Stygiomarasmius scandens]|uniref:Uncharacterized protein n=1 Tax=Marasmiellus scandens TaxID=2682957 RepID=A0ABR1J4N8_9AGAR